MLKGYFRKNDVEIIFAGNQMSSTYLSELLAYLNDKDFSINVISKSGTTTEPAIAFRALKKLAEENMGLVLRKEYMLQLMLKRSTSYTC